MALAVVASLTFASAAGAQTASTITGWNEYSTPCDLGSANGAPVPNTSNCDLLVTLTGSDGLDDVDIFTVPSDAPYVTSLPQLGGSATRHDMPAGTWGYSELKIGKHTAVTAFAVYDYSADYSYVTNSYPLTGWNLYIKPDLFMDEGIGYILLRVGSGSLVRVGFAHQHHSYSETQTDGQPTPTVTEDNKQGWQYSLVAAQIPTTYNFGQWLMDLSPPSLDEYCGGGWADWHEDGNGDDTIDAEADPTHADHGTYTGSDYKEPDPVAGGYCVAN